MVKNLKLKKMMTAIERYWDRDNLRDISLEERIAFDIFEDLRGRKGLVDDVDSEIQSEILETWIDKIKIWVR